MWALCLPHLLSTLSAETDSVMKLGFSDQRADTGAAPACCLLSTGIIDVCLNVHLFT